MKNWMKLQKASDLENAWVVFDLLKSHFTSMSIADFNWMLDRIP